MQPVIDAIVRLSRLKFLVGGLLGGALGTAVAAFERGTVDWGAYATAQAAITSLHLMTHYANDFFDRECDRGAERTPFSGGSGVLPSGALAPGVALGAAGVCAALGLFWTAVLLVAGKAAAAGVAVSIAALAWAYSAPPLRLLGRGLGELDTSLVVAVLVPLCAYAAQTGRVGANVIAAALPAAGAMFAMMVAVEVPDVESDAAAGKRTLVVRAGRQRAHALVQAALAVSVAGVGVALLSGAPLTLAPLALVALLPAFGLLACLRRHAWRHRAGRAEIAARGVTLFFLASLGSLLGYVVAIP